MGATGIVQLLGKIIECVKEKTMQLDFKEVKNDVSRRMKAAVDILRQEFGGLRSGRASVTLLDPISVDAYGSAVPLNQIASVSAPEARMLTIQVWDISQVKSVEKAVLESGLGLNPSTEGQLIRISIPPLTEERRKEFAKVAAKYAEDARVAVRNIRRHIMDDLKQNEKNGDISKDAYHDYTGEIQKLTDDYVNSIDSSLSQKNIEITQV